MSYYSKSPILITLIASILTMGCQSTPKQLTADLANKEATDLQSLFEKQSVLKAANVGEALQKARTSRIRGDASLAVAYYIKAFNMEPENTEVLMEMAEVYQSLDKPDLVEVCYQTILKSNPENREVLERYGLLLVKQDKLTEAEEILTKVNASDKRRWKVLNGLGILSDLKRKHVEARQYYDLANEINPNNPELLNNKGYSFYMENRLEDALAFYLRALKVDPGFKKAAYNYALIQGRLGNYRDAFVIFSKALNPPKANNNIGYIALMNGDLDEAEFYLQQAVKLSPRYYPKAYENLRELKERKMN